MADLGPETTQPESERVTISLSVNGMPSQINVSADQRLATLLRDDQGLTGTKLGCSIGVCGTCTVLVDGRPTSSCLTLTAQVDGAEILTIEGFDGQRGLAPLQQAFMDEGGFQCGFCTSGQLVTLASLVLDGRLSTMTHDEVTTHLQGNLCRCTGYYGILRAVERVRR